MNQKQTQYRWGWLADETGQAADLFCHNLNSFGKYWTYKK